MGDSAPADIQTVKNKRCINRGEGREMSESVKTCRKLDRFIKEEHTVWLILWTPSRPPAFFAARCYISVVVFPYLTSCTVSRMWREANDSYWSRSQKRTNFACRHLAFSENCGDLQWFKSSVNLTRLEPARFRFRLSTVLWYRLRTRDLKRVMLFFLFFLTFLVPDWRNSLFLSVSWFVYIQQKQDSS